MTKTRLLALLGAALALLVAAPAGAGQHSFSAVSSATGLRLAVTPPGSDPQQLIVGHTQARIQSGPVEGGCPGESRACSTAAAVSEPFGTTVTTNAPGDPGPKSASGGSIPAPLNAIVAGEFGVGTAQSTTEPGPKGQADATATRLDITLTQSLVDQVPQVGEAIETISGTLGPILDQDPSGQVGPRVKGVLELIAENIGSAPIATITSGPSSSFSADASGTTTATSFARGGSVIIAPTAVSLPGSPEGLVIIEVGSSSANATTDQLTGKATFQPAVVRLRVFDPTEESGFREVTVATGDEKTCGGQAPLVACIGAGSGKTTVQGAAAAAEAQAVTVELFADPLPVVTLEFAAATAGVNAAPAQTPPPPVTDLPKTGADLALPAGLLLATGVLGRGFVRRRRAA